MEKDFGKWHILKTDLQRREGGPFFAKREIWICSVGLNLGHEEDGKGDRFLRPVVIFKKFTSDLFWGIPLTSSDKSGPSHYQFNFLVPQIETPSREEGVSRGAEAHCDSSIAGAG